MIISDADFTFTEPISTDRFFELVKAKYGADCIDNEFSLEGGDAVINCGLGWSVIIDDETSKVTGMVSGDGGNQYDSDDVSNHIAETEDMSAFLTASGIKFKLEDYTDADQIEDDDQSSQHAHEFVIDEGESNLTVWFDEGNSGFYGKIKGTFNGKEIEGDVEYSNDGMLAIEVKGLNDAEQDELFSLVDDQDEMNNVSAAYYAAFDKDSVEDSVPSKITGRRLREDDAAQTPAAPAPRAKKVKEAKRYKVTAHRDRGSSIDFVGTVPELIQKFSYTLECGASYQHEKGNKKINRNPSNIASLISNLNNAVNNSAANGYAGKYYTAEEVAAPSAEAAPAPSTPSSVPESVVEKLLEDESEGDMTPAEVKAEVLTSLANMRKDLSNSSAMSTIARMTQMEDWNYRTDVYMALGRDGALANKILDAAVEYVNEIPEREFREGGAGDKIYGLVSHWAFLPDNRW